MKRSSMMFFAFFCFLALTATARKFVGGDVSLLPSYEQNGAVYLDGDGSRIADLLDFFRQKGWNAMRVRLFVDPSKASATDRGEGVRQDLDYVCALGRRIRLAGFRFMLDFHYSDTWTDPGQHATPSAWNGGDADELAAMVYDYTADALNVLKAAGAQPDFIQTGNEITYGMLWPTGHCYADGGDYGSGSWGNFAMYLKAATRACREVCPDARIVLQTEMSRPYNVTNFYKTAKAYGIDYDVIGISYYPFYHGSLATLEGVIAQLESAWPDKRIEIVETGYFHKWYPGGATYPVTMFPDWPASDEGQRRFAADLVEMLNRHGGVDGLYWWWPEANEYGLDWQTSRVTDNWYNASLWDNETGRALPAIDELRAFAPDDTGIGLTPASPRPHPLTPSPKGEGEARGKREESKYVYDLQGRKLADNLSSLPSPLSSKKGIYIVGGKKIVIK